MCVLIYYVHGIFSGQSVLLNFYELVLFGRTLVIVV